MLELWWQVLVRDWMAKKMLSFSTETFREHTGHIHVIWIVGIAVSIPELCHKLRWCVTHHDGYRERRIRLGGRLCTFVRLVRPRRLGCLGEVRDEVGEVDAAFGHTDVLACLERRHRLHEIRRVISKDLRFVFPLQISGFIGA